MPWMIDDRTLAFWDKLDTAALKQRHRDLQEEIQSMGSSVAHIEHVLRRRGEDDLAADS